MSSIAADSFSDNSTVGPSARHSWRKIILTMAAVLATAAAIYSFFPQKAWVEVIGQGVLRTTASEKQIADARQAVIAKHQNWIDKGEGKKNDPTFSQRGQSWRAAPTPEVINVEVTRGKTEITDKDGNTISLEEITATDQPTLLFIQCGNGELTMQLINEFVDELENRGVTMRMP